MSFTSKNVIHITIFSIWFSWFLQPQDVGHYRWLLWFSLKTFYDTAAGGALHDYHSAVLAQFCSDLHHFQIFGDNLPNTVLFHIQLTRKHLNSQPTIAEHHLPNPLDVDLCPVCWRSSTLGVIFHLITRFLKPLLPLKNPCARHGVISIHMLKHFKCMRWDILQPD